ncbi:MAG: DUF1697 domain-containing protein [Candidatus Acidiferrales bacterium]
MARETMTTFIALLRGINVGGHQLISMADLRDLLAKLKFADVRSLVQSGNLVFRSDRKNSDQIERLLEDELEKRLKIRTDFFVRTAAEWDAIIANNPFRKEAERDSAHLVALLLKTEPDPKQIAALKEAIAGPERFFVHGKLAYIVYPNGIGTSKLTNPLLDRKLETRGTSRNWNTVLKLAALIRE